MAQRDQPPWQAMLELQQNFPTLTIGAFDGDWAAFEFEFLTASPRLPVSKFKLASVAYSTGCLAKLFGVDSKYAGC